jgi:hypothetical protein
MKLSASGRYLGFVENSDGGQRILDMSTGKVMDPHVRDRLPTNMRYFADGPNIWCPYDDSKFVVLVVTLTDTVGDGKDFIYGQHLFEMSVDGSLFKDVTPVTKAGMAGPVQITPLAWLVGSSAQADSLLAYYSNVAPAGISKIFVPQSGMLIPRQFPSGLLAQSKDRFREASVKDAENFDPPLYINGIEIKFPSPPGKIEKASWSPDGKKLAISVLPYYDTVTKTGGFREVWIADIDRYFSEGLSAVPLQIINFQKDFCTYNAWGTFGEFITNSTIAVTMHGIDADASYIYEITLDGKMVRQLTSEP